MFAESRGKGAECALEIDVHFGQCGLDVYSGCLPSFS